MGPAQFLRRADIAGIGESLHVVSVIPVQMGKQADINIGRIKSQMPHRIGTI